MQAALKGVRPSVAGRSADGLIGAVPMLADYDYATKYRKTKKGSKGAGHRFEAFVVGYLEKRYPTFISSLPFAFRTEYQPKAVCIPDGLLVRKDEVLVVEVKLRRTIDAWFQLRKLYAPVVERSFQKSVRCLVIEKFPDPDVRFPEPVQVVNSFEMFLQGSKPFGALTLWHRKEL